MATGGQAESSSDEYIEYPCSVCEKRKTQSDSGHYCLTCKGFLCVNCLPGHNQYTPDHQVLAVSEKKFQQVLTERCVNHPEEVIEHYCGNHDALLCNKCDRLDHRLCKDVKQINEAADELNADRKFQVVPDKLQSTLDRVNQAMTTIDTYVDKVQKKGHTYLRDLEDHEQRLIARIRELTEMGRKSIKNAQNQLISAAKERRKECVKTRVSVSKCLEDVKRSQKRKAHLIVLKKNGQGLVNGANDMCIKAEDFIRNRPFVFKPNTQIDDCLKAYSSLVTEVKLYKSRLSSDIDLKIRKDKDVSYILSSCRLDDGTLVLSDYENEMMKRVDLSTNKVTVYCRMSNRPSGVCRIGPQELAVADESNTVQILSTVKGLTPSRTVDMGQKTAILACHGGEMFAGRWDSLRIHDMSGKVIRDISRDTDGQLTFSIITGIAVNQAGDRVYVSDLINGLVCVSRDGRVVFRLSEDDMGLNVAYDVTIDQRGCVMVAGALSHNVVQVSEEGQVFGEIITKKDGIWGPRCLSYDVEGSKLYVGGQIRKSRLLGFELS